MSYFDHLPSFMRTGEVEDPTFHDKDPPFSRMTLTLRPHLPEFSSWSWLLGALTFPSPGFSRLKTQCTPPSEGCISFPLTMLIYSLITGRPGGVFLLTLHIFEI